MDTYKFAIIRPPQNHSLLKIECTDPSVLEWIFNELKKLFPDLNQVNLVQFNSAKGFIVFGFSLHDLENQHGPQDYGVMWWIMQQLCLHGWEPIGAAETGTSHYYQFRLKVQVGLVLPP